MFCEVLIKIKFTRKMSKFWLTDIISKSNKKTVKLLQKVSKTCYNAYTINTERDDRHEVCYCRKKY